MTEIYYTGFTEAEIMQFESYLQRVLNNLEKPDIEIGEAARRN